MRSKKWSKGKADLSISSTQTVQIQNSTDLERGAAPQLKSVEFLICTVGVDEILYIHTSFRAKKVLLLLGISHRIAIIIHRIWLLYAGVYPCIEPSFSVNIISQPTTIWQRHRAGDHPPLIAGTCLRTPCRRARPPVCVGHARTFPPALPRHNGRNPWRRRAHRVAA